MSETVRVVDEGDDYAVLEIEVDADRILAALAESYPIHLPGTRYSVVLEGELQEIPEIDRPRRLRLAIAKVEAI
jgi:hypothetical protein